MLAPLGHTPGVAYETIVAPPPLSQQTRDFDPRR